MKRNAPTKAYFLYLGGNVKDLGRKSIRFVVETTYPMQNERNFKGKIVAAAKNALQPVGYESNGWASPIGDAKDNLFTSFHNLILCIFHPDHIFTFSHIIFNC